jgi:hypothetical protein
MLIRGVGPTLASLGVSGTLANPRLDILRQGAATPMAGNDDWDPALTAAFTRVGAFALTAGSRDAALLITVPPGSYTAQVSGVDDTTGVALIEVYEVP